MKQLFSEKGNMITKCFVFQIAMSIFGIMFAFAIAKHGNGALLAGGIFSVLFYFALMGAALNEDGLKDSVAVERYHRKKDYFKGIKYVFISYIPSLFVTVVCSACRTFGILPALSDILNIIIRFFLSGMYLSFDTVLFSTGTVEELNSISLSIISDNGYTLIVYQLFSIIVCGLFYFIGLKGINLLPDKKKDI